MNPLCPVCGHPVRVVGDDREGTMHYEPDEAEARREGWDAALAAGTRPTHEDGEREGWSGALLTLRREYLASVRPGYRDGTVLQLLDRLASEGPR